MVDKKDPLSGKPISSGIQSLMRKLASVKEWRFAIQSKKAILEGMRGFGQEVQETKSMAQLFFRMLECKLDMEKRKTPPTKEEVKEALEQLKDVGRFSIFTSISLLPGGGFSLIGLELLARKFGVKNFTFIPSAFRKKRATPKAGPLDEEKILEQLQELQEGKTEPNEK